MPIAAAVQRLPYPVVYYDGKYFAKVDWAMVAADRMHALAISQAGTRWVLRLLVASLHNI